MTAVTTNATDDTNATAVTEEGGGEEEFPPLPFPILDSFTMTFEEPGTYEYFCAFHPGMYGIVTVAGEEGEGSRRGRRSVSSKYDSSNDKCY